MARIDHPRLDTRAQYYIRHRFSAQAVAQPLALDTDLDASSVRGDPTMSYLLAIGLSAQRDCATQKFHPAIFNPMQHCYI
jgi:hypothetical protein